MLEQVTRWPAVYQIFTTNHLFVEYPRPLSGKMMAILFFEHEFHVWCTMYSHPWICHWRQIPCQTEQNSKTCDQDLTCIAFQVLAYTAGHINYGGRVTDDWDRRCLMNILSNFYDPVVIKTDYFYSVSGIFRQIDPENDLNVSYQLLLKQHFHLTGKAWNLNYVYFDII